MGPRRLKLCQRERAIVLNLESVELSYGAIQAVKGVTLNVNEGEVVTIIGANGAGKSTLLKVLSRITSPTTGRVVTRGRAASLLEVGTGFHPELTGRENIFLNGSILGMPKQEIRRKFDEIVDFAEVEEFLEAVDQLREATDRLDARLSRAESRARAAPK